MAQHTFCPFRYVYKGRTFCAVAVRERRFTTAHVTADVCSKCPVPSMLNDHSCRHLDFGVEIDEYGPQLEVVFVYVACTKLVEELSDLSGCTADACGLWELADDAVWEAVRKKALRRHRILEQREERK